MRFDIETVIYSYLFICVALLVYNIVYIFRSTGRNKRQEKTQKSWEQQIRQQLDRLSRGEEVTLDHQNRILSKLRRIQHLFAYGTSLDLIAQEEPILTELYMQANLGTIQTLASDYVKKDSMDRAYFAYLIAQHRPCDGQEFRPLMEILLSFMEDATVYCKENVFKALYALGNCQAVENALQIFNDRNWFHHQKLLSDGLLTFSGDRDELAARLWSHYGQWNEELMLSIIQFITGFSENYREPFFPILQREETDIEIRLAILRYYRRHHYEPVHSLLITYLWDEKEGDNLKIVSAFVLSRYPGEGTVAALKHALSHHNWYVRYNAASSLVELDVPAAELEDVFAGNDQYAKEILIYMLEDAKGGGAV